MIRIKEINTKTYEVLLSKSGDSYTLRTQNMKTGRINETPHIKDYFMASYMFDLAIEEFEAK